MLGGGSEEKRHCRDIICCLLVLLAPRCECLRLVSFTGVQIDFECAEKMEGHQQSVSSAIITTKSSQLTMHITSRAAAVAVSSMYINFNMSHTTTK